MPIPLGIFAVAGAGAGGGSAYELLETTVLGSNTASITFSSLGSYSDYKHLQIRYVAKTSNTADFAILRLNGVTTTSYASHVLRGSGGEVASNSSTSATSISARQVIGSVANAFTAGVIDILDFNVTTKNKTIRMLNGAPSSELNNVCLVSGFLDSTAAVTSVFLGFGGATNFATGSRFSLYGIK